MKENVRKNLENCIIVFIICFLILFVFNIYEEYEYYSTYPKEELEDLVSIKKIILFNLGQSFSGSVMLAVVFVPILAIFKKIKIKNIFKIVITLVLTFIISFIYMILNFL